MILIHEPVYFYPEKSLLNINIQLGLQTSVLYGTRKIVIKLFVGI